MDAIVAVYSDWGIGCTCTQPVVIPEDRKHFARLTDGAAVIVGRKTLEDFPGGKPLKNRVNIVLTRRNIEIEGAIVVHTAEEALAEAQRFERVLVIGGESVYLEMLPHISRVFVTRIEVAPHCDVYFPNLDEDEGWRCTDEGEPLDSCGVKYRFCTYERI